MLRAGVPTDFGAPDQWAGSALPNRFLYAGGAKFGRRVAVESRLSQLAASAALIPMRADPGAVDVPANWEASTIDRGVRASVGAP